MLTRQRQAGERRLASVLVIGALAVSVLAVAGGGGLASGAEAAKRKPPSQAAVAAKLAKGVTAARTSAARYKAVLAVMKTLGIPVYRAKGGVLTRRARNIPRGYGLYDFQLRVIAAAFARRDTTDLTELADRLTTIGFNPGGDPVDADELHGALIATVGRAAAAPRKRSSLVGLLLRQLGLRHQQPYDLARGVGAGNIQLDPLQTTLIVSDALIAAAGAPAARRMQASAAEHPCDSQAAKSLEEVSPLGKFFVELWGGLKEGAKATVGRIASAATIFQGEALALSVAVRAAGPIEQSTHYGPAGHGSDAGKPLDFTVRVVMLDDYGDILVKCGALVGMKFPKKGPIPGVTIFWHNDKVEDYLEKHGTVSGGGETDETGRATQRFVPNAEKTPGFGTLRHASNSRRAIALYQSAFGNAPGAIAQFLFPKLARFYWTLDYHKPRGFKTSGLKWRYVEAGQGGEGEHEDGTSSYELKSLHICGANPYNGLWTGTVHAIDNHQLAGPDYVFDGDVEAAWTPEGDERGAQGTLGFVRAFAPTYVHRPPLFLDFPPLAPAQVRLGPLRTNLSTVTAEAITSTAPIEEDLSCPDNPD